MHRFSSTLLYLAFLALLPLAQPASAQERTRPNILFCIADDWGWPHAGAYGDKVVQTPTFDRLAQEGVLFERAFAASPSCTPSRNAVLTGQHPWRLGPGASLWSWLDKEHPVYPLLLEEAGYHVGHWRKSWGPGKLHLGGYENEHPAGKQYKQGFGKFLEDKPEGAPFCFWLGAWDPHRGYELGSGAESGMDLEAIELPAFWPDHRVVRSDVADYYMEVQRFDRDVGEALALLERRGELENTIVVMTSDHGMPFPRCKANLYDMGIRVPLAVRYGAEVATVPRGERSQAFVSLVDIAPTFLEAAGVEVPDTVQGRSLFSLISQPTWRDPMRQSVIFGRERHTAGRPGGVGYPARGLRTERFAYLRNLEPDRWPAGDPPFFMDCDPHATEGKGVTKGAVLRRRESPEGQHYFDWCFGKRPAEELYDMNRDPHQLHNLAANPDYAEVLAGLRAQLDEGLVAVEDPRALGEEIVYDSYPYFGGGVWREPKGH